MGSFVGVIILLLASFSMGEPGLAQGKESGVIDGRVYDLYEAAITNVLISIENLDSGELTRVRTDHAGGYSATVSPGRYRVTRSPSAGYPIGYVHAYFNISAREKVTINFRPKPFTISDSIEEGHWTERYIGTLPMEATHFIQQSSGTIRDLRIQYHELRMSHGVFEYKFSVTASFDKFTIYADSVTLDTKKGKLMARGDLLFEDGSQVRRPGRVIIDLLARSAVVSTESEK